MSDFATVEQAIEDIKNGKMIVVVDDEDRENEGDLIVAAATVTPEDINFMATYAKGLICTPIDGKRLDELNIGQMVVNNTDNHETAFTVSIDAYDTETGISAFERCHTVKKLLDPKAKPASFRRPGHVFPLRSVGGGVLRRAGHTETTTDLARLAGFYPAGLCCEIMDDDGHMMRTPRLKEFAKKHGLHIITVKSLIEYRKRTENFVHEVADVDFPSKYGHFRIHAYENELNNKCDIAIVKGDVRGKKDVLVRVHSECLTGDALGSMRCDCGDQLALALKKIEAEGEGVVLYMRQEGRGIGLANRCAPMRCRTRAATQSKPTSSSACAGSARLRHRRPDPRRPRPHEHPPDDEQSGEARGPRGLRPRDHGPRAAAGPRQQVRQALPDGQESQDGPSLQRRHAEVREGYESKGGNTHGKCI